jgi:hypothetical protein
MFGNLHAKLPSNAGEAEDRSPAEFAVKTYLIPLAILALAMVVFVGLVQPAIVLN